MSTPSCGLDCGRTGHWSHLDCNNADQRGEHPSHNWDSDHLAYGPYWCAGYPAEAAWAKVAQSIDERVDAVLEREGYEPGKRYLLTIEPGSVIGYTKGGQTKIVMLHPKTEALDISDLIVERFHMKQLVCDRCQPPGSGRVSAGMGSAATCPVCNGTGKRALEES